MEQRLSCPFAAPGELTANAGSGFWSARAAVELRDTTTGAEPEQKTCVRTAWNEREWRLLFEAEDAHPWATLTEHDAPLYTEEVVEVFFDPVGDLESYFEIEVNPRNAVLDVVLRRNRSGYLKDFGWHCAGLQTRVKLTPTGWNAELSIPFSAVVAEAPRGGDTWRVNFFRIDRPIGRERELSAWCPTGRPQFHVPERFGTIEFCPPGS